MSFKSQMVDDLQKVFLNTDDFGEMVTLVRGQSTYAMKGLYDELPLNGEGLGGNIDAISHNPRLFVSASDLPEGAPRKGDVFVLSANEFHAERRFIAKDFEFPKDGLVVYYLKDRNQ